MSITLNSNAINQLIVGGVTIETDGAIAVTAMRVDFTANTLSFDLQKGTVAGATFTPGQIILGNLSVTIDATTGKWFVNGSGQTGTLSGGGLTTLQGQIKTWRNQLETFSQNQAITSGTVVPW
jgi:hypothetical protein